MEQTTRDLQTVHDGRDAIGPHVKHHDLPGGWLKRMASQVYVSYLDQTECQLHDGRPSDAVTAAVP
jgi:hypothetical protein